MVIISILMINFGGDKMRFGCINKWPGGTVIFRGQGGINNRADDDARERERAGD